MLKKLLTEKIEQEQFKAFTEKVADLAFENPTKTHHDVIALGCFSKFLTDVDDSLSTVRSLVMLGESREIVLKVFKICSENLMKFKMVLRHPDLRRSSPELLAFHASLLSKLNDDFTQIHLEILSNEKYKN